MSGIINSQAPAPISPPPGQNATPPGQDAPSQGQSHPGELSNPLLDQAEQQVERQLTPENRANYTKVVVAGMHAALDKGPDGILASLRKSADPVSDCAKGAISLVLILRKDARGVMPLKAMVPAAMTLMLKALDFADRSGIVKVGQPELVRATHIFTDTLFARFGITKDGLKRAGEKVYALAQDPAAMQKMTQKAAAGEQAGA